jgi:hypothetical protein
MTREEANRIADAILEAESAERERCARIADLWVNSKSCDPAEPCDCIRTAAEIAKRIREGGHA